jgi:hypothetical protein
MQHSDSAEKQIGKSVIRYSNITTQGVVFSTGRPARDGK